MFGIGPGELIVIILVALVVLGPEKLPAAARILGRLTGEMRRLSTEFQRTLHEDADPARTSPRTAGAVPKDEDAESDFAPAPGPAQEPEPDALDAANVIPADFTGFTDANADTNAQAQAGRVASGGLDAPDREAVPAASLLEGRGRS